MERSLVEWVERSVEARGDEITDADVAVVALARKYARQIDAGVDEGGQAATKALYLGPHLLKTMSALGCSPEARGEFAEIVGASKPARGPDRPAEPEALNALRRKRGSA